MEKRVYDDNVLNRYFIILGSVLGIISTIFVLSAFLALLGSPTTMTIIQVTAGVSLPFVIVALSLALVVSLVNCLPIIRFILLYKQDVTFTVIDQESLNSSDQILSQILMKVKSHFSKIRNLPVIVVQEKKWFILIIFLSVASWLMLLTLSMFSLVASFASANSNPSLWWYIIILMPFTLLISTHLNYRESTIGTWYLLDAMRSNKIDYIMAVMKLGFIVDTTFCLSREDYRIIFRTDSKHVDEKLVMSISVGIAKWIPNAEVSINKNEDNVTLVHFERRSEDFLQRLLKPIYMS